MPAATPLPPIRHRRDQWLLALPKLGIVLLVGAVLSLLWLLHQNDLEEERNALIKDVLWLEQNLRFHLGGNQEQLQQLALDLVGNSGERDRTFRVRATHLVKNGPEIERLALLDTRRRVLEALPAALQPGTALEDFAPETASKAFSIASRLGKPVYTEPFGGEQGGQRVQLMVPVYERDRLSGMIVAVYSLDSLLDTLVPWWFTEKYRVLILDDNDNPLAAKSKIEGKPTQHYEIPIDPPGYGLKLRVTAYQSTSNPLQRLLAGAIIVLAAGVFYSLWAIRSLMQKRAAAENALRAEHAFRKSMEDSLTVGMRARDFEGHIIYVNPAFCRMTGYSSEELVGAQAPMPYWAPDLHDETMALHLAVMSGNAPPDGFEVTLQRKSGERFRALVYEAPLIDGHGQHIGWMGSVLDITERRNAEELARQQAEQLQFSARLVTMGEMASTLAHELNQPLAAIASYNAGCLNLLESDNLEPQDLRSALQKIGTQAERAGRIIRRVHDFVKKSEPQRSPCRLEAIVEECIGFTEAEARKRQIRLQVQLGTLPEITADRLMLEQVLLNLLRNAMEAMNDTPPAERSITLRAGIESGEVTVAVIDHGSGIAPEIADKLFTAFTTTKPGGMGMGLSICRSIIEFHRGRLWAETNPDGRGTTFRFTLPQEAA